MFDLDAHIGIHARALQLRSQRSELIANNLANADTPNFKARDLDFRAALADAAGSAGSLRLATPRGATAGATLPATTNAPLGFAGGVQYRTALAPSLDGNTVDVQIEQAAFSENAVRYQATLSFIGSRLRGLMTAITGQ